jgi:exonuclease SbcD
MGPFDLLELVQRPALDSIVEIAREERPDAVVIAGDLYDRAVPSEAAMQAFEDSVTQLRAIAPVIAIAGNHDGAGRVSHFGSVLAGAGIHISAADFGRVPHVALHDGHGEVRFHLMPFATPDEVRQAFKEGAELDAADGGAAPLSSHELATVRRLATVDLCPKARHVLVGHLFTQSGKTAHTSDSERDISVGGSSLVSHSHFERFSYVALGHLHKPHDVVPGRIRYSGSIGRFSFSEESHGKSVSVVEIHADGSTSVREVILPHRHGMRTIRGLFAEVLRAAPADPQRSSAFVRVVLSDTTPQYEAYRRLSEHYRYLIEVSYENREVGEGGQVPAADRPERQDPFAMVKQYCRDQQGGKGLSRDAESLAQKLMDEARGSSREEVES